MTNQRVQPKLPTIPQQPGVNIGAGTRASVIYVTTAKDSVPGSLRDAIKQANAIKQGNNYIIITPAVGNKIKLTDGELKVSADVDIVNQTQDDLTIQAAAATATTTNVAAPPSKSKSKKQRLF